VEVLEPDVKFEFATDEIPVLQEDKDKLATRLVALLDKQVITVEYMREQLGIPPDAGPSTDEIKQEAEKQMEAEAEAARPAALTKWKKKAVNCLKQGGYKKDGVFVPLPNANVPFETDELSPALQGALRARLGQARTLEEVDSIFSSTIGTTKVMNEAMQKVTKALEELKPPEPQPVHVDVHVPPQPAPVVNVSVKMPKLRGTTQKVNRNQMGYIESTTQTHEYEESD